MLDKSATTPYQVLQELSDEELMVQLQVGNHDALAVILDRYQRLVWSVAQKIIRDRGEADDIVQMVFLEFFKKVGLFDPQRGILKVWILQLAYSRSINRRYYLQRRQFYNQIEVNEEQVGSFDRPSSLAFRLSAGETSRMVREAIGMLNPRQRTAVELIALEGLTFDELAIRMTETLSNAKHHYYRGMMKLREFLSEAALPSGRSTEDRSRKSLGGLPC
jgi:RNA polymerase sigma-70 factor, ECF subfamily